jgi:hypothetical protein
MIVFGLALVYGLLLVLSLRGPYLLYRLWKGKPRVVWWPWEIGLWLLTSTALLVFMLATMEGD